MGCTYTYKGVTYNSIEKVKQVVGLEEFSKENPQYSVLEPFYEILRNKGEVLSHEYAHHYVSWFRDTDLIKEAINKWGSEEALVQAIGKQVVKQNGEAYNWWTKFTKWVKDLFSNLSVTSKEELRNIITDAMLSRQNIATFNPLTTEEMMTRRKSGLYNQQVKPTEIKEDTDALKNALETAMSSLNNRIKALKIRGKQTEKALKKQEDLLEKLTTNYREKHYLLGLTEYLSSASDYFADLYGVDEYTDPNGKVIPATTGRIEALGKEVKDATFEEAITLSSTIKGMGNFAASYINTTEEIIKTLKEFDFENASTKADARKVINTAKAVKAEAEEVKGDYATFSRIILSKFLAPFGWQGSIKQLEKVLADPIKDISGSQRWLDGLVNANDDVLNLLSIATVNYKEDAREEVIKLEKSLVKLKKKLEANGIKITKWMASSYSNGDISGNFVTERDWDNFERDRKAMFSRLEKKYGVSYQERDSLLVDKQKAYQKEVGQWFGKNVLTNTQALSLIEQNKANMSEKDFDRWFKLNVKYDELRDRYTIPTKKSSNYSTIESNPLMKEYYNTIIDLKIQLEKHFPEKFRHTRRMPQVRKDAIERMKVGDIKGIANNIKEHFKVMEDESERGTDFGIVDEKGSVINFIPIYYTNRLQNMNHLSLDVTSSMMEYARMAIERDHMNTIVDVLEIGKDLLSQREILKTNNKGKIVQAVNNVLGKKIEKQATEPITGGNAYKMYETFLDMIVYGKMHKQETLLGADLGKVLDTVGRYTSVKQLGLNTFASIANVLTGKAHLRIEAMAKEFFNYKDLLYADKIYAENMPGFVADVGQRLPQNKLTLWNEYMDVLEDFDERINSLDIEQKKRFTRMFRVSNLFFLSHMGEHYLHSRGSLALANEFKFDPNTGRFTKKKDYFKEVTKLKDELRAKIKAIDVKSIKEEGKSTKNEINRLKKLYEPQIKQLEDKLNNQWKELTNYWDAHEVVDKELQLKKEYQNKYSAEDRRKFTALTRSTNQSLHGIYNTYDRNALQQIAVGRLVMMFRKWMKPAWNRRFQQLKHDYRKGSEIEGYYATTWRFIQGLRSDLKAGQMSILKNWNTLNDMEKANFRRAMAEVSYLMAVLALSTILVGLSGSDDDDWAFNMLAYQANRQVTEIGALVPGPLMLSEGLRLIQSPLAATRMAEELITFTQFWNWGDELSRGKYKGMTKLEKSLIRTIPPFQAVHDLKYPEEKLVFFTR